MGIMSFIRWLFGADAAAPPDAMKLDGTTEATLARSLSALPVDERGWITFCRSAHLVLDRGRGIRVRRNGPGRQKEHRVLRCADRSIINFMPVEGRVYFVRR